MKVASRFKFIIFCFGFILFFLLFTSVRAELDCLHLDPEKASAGDGAICSTQLTDLMSKYQKSQETNKKDFTELQSQMATLKKRILEMYTKIENCQSKN